ncbi:MAG TPA: SDR family NAD(P)-dependent oxidoreductase [Gaiellales bacterium]|jgi:NAD(P)-dependent dehydrogenase (short-subunit alcohol dehydrogenase family)|nr:SDR family NAD(P)-dependent oxidoreductase [Gaiellales bacterium]
MTSRDRLAGLVDATLEASVVGGFSRIGPSVRGRVEHWTDPPSLEGRVCLVTGATGGLGLAAATRMGHLGASLRLLVRDAERGETARARIVAETGNDDVRCELADISLRRSVRACAQRLLDSGEPVHVLVHNAGVLSPEWRETSEGLELTFATNVLGPHLLTRLLRERLVESARARVLFVSSGDMYTSKLDVDDLQSRIGSFDGRMAHGRSKRAEVVLAERWAEELAGTGVVVHAMHPGWAYTPGSKSSIPIRRVMRPLLRTPEQGADTIVWLAAAEEPGRLTGRFWCDRHARATHRLGRTRETAEDRDRLWHELEAVAAGASARI